MKSATFIVLICFLTSICAAQDSLDTSAEFEELMSMSLEELLSVELETGSFIAQGIKQASSSMTVISSEQIKASGARHLSEVLEIYVPGFQYMINKWTGITWGMRGVASDRTTKFIFLVNGHKMNTESRDGANTELDLGLLDDIERIEVLRGPAGLVYGSGAIAGVINIVTETYDNDAVRVSAKVSTYAMETYGTELQTSVGQRISEDATLRADFGYRQSEGVGAQKARILGRPQWPYPQQEYDNPPQNGVPSMGSALSTPGNYKFGVDFSFKDNLRIYSRWTHQVTNSAGWFPLDAWPEVAGVPVEGDGERVIDGKYYSGNSIYGNMESFNNNRRQYVFNNISTQAVYKIDMGENSLNIRSGADAFTNRIQFEDLKGYESVFASEGNTYIQETFGENRYNLSGTYMLTSVDRLELAVGNEFRVYDIGDDMSGLNARYEMTKQKIVSDVLYLYNSTFTEGVYEVHPKFDLHFGLRYDLHTRTISNGGVLNPKLGGVYKFNSDNFLKLVYQQSANNGSADNYEFNRFHFNADGNVYEGDDYHFFDDNFPVDVVAPVKESDLHSLKPERSQSLELMSFNAIGDHIVLLPSVSYNQISNLFAWNQTLFRVVNAGEYRFFNIDIDAQYVSNRLTAGINHTMQRPWGGDLGAQSYISEDAAFDPAVYDSSLVNGVWRYTPVRLQTVDGRDSSKEVTNNFVRDGITADGEYFLNLSTHVTKFYFDYKLVPWLTMHYDTRVFWALKGRTDVHEFDPENNSNKYLQPLSNLLANASNYPYLGVHNMPIVKANIGIVLGRKDQAFNLSFYVYDIFAGDGSEINRNSIRWGQCFDVGTSNGLYAMDYRSFAFKLTYNL